MDPYDPGAPRRRTRSRFDDEDDPRPLRRPGRAVTLELEAEPEAEPEIQPDDGPDADPDGADGRLSSWGEAQHGPDPAPGWLVTSPSARDRELGILKTGKEADVHLVERSLEGTAPCLLAAKRYRPPEHRLFHRDAGYTEGRRVRRSRETRAMARRTEFGRDLLAGQWAAAEFEALARLWLLAEGGAPIRVPYPVQLLGTEVMLEFLGEDDGSAAPRLAQLRPDPPELAGLWRQTVDALGVLALAGYAHGDLSPYNVLVHRGRLVLIDLPQVVDVVANPQGPRFLARDVAVMVRWFVARGLPERVADAERLTGSLLADAGLH